MKNLLKHLLAKSGKANFAGPMLLFVFLAMLILTKPISQDEGVFLTIGKHINQGALPYQDFFDHKPPAIYFLFAALFKAFGTNVWVVKVALILSIFSASVVVKKIGEIVKPGTGWLAVSIFLFLMTQFEGYFLIAEPFMLLPLLVALWLLIDDRNNPWRMFIAGLAVGVTLLFKQTAVLSAIPLLILAFTKPKNKKMLVAGMLLSIFIVVISLLAKRDVLEFWRQVVVLTLTSYPRESLATAVQLLKNNFLYTLPIWILMLPGIKIDVMHKKILWALVLLPLPFLFYRHYPHYWVQILPFVAIIAASAVINIRSRALTLAMLIFCVAIAGGKVGQDAVKNWGLLQEQLRVADVLRHEPATLLLAENQFSGFYFLLPQQPLNTFLYITEITNAAGAEQQTIDDVQRGKTVMILWPVDTDYAYAKKLQGFVLEGAIEKYVFSQLGMRVLRYTAVVEKKPAHAPL